MTVYEKCNISVETFLLFRLEQIFIALVCIS